MFVLINGFVVIDYCMHLDWVANVISHWWGGDGICK